MRDINIIAVRCAKCGDPCHHKLIWCGMCPCCKTAKFGGGIDPITGSKLYHFIHKPTLPFFTKENVAKSRGMDFMFYDEEDEKWMHCFVAECSMEKGITLKDYNNNNPDNFVYCHNLTYFHGHTDSLVEAQSCVVALLNHIFINGHTTFATIMLNFDVSANWIDVWGDEQEYGVSCPF